CRVSLFRVSLFLAFLLRGSGLTLGQLAEPRTGGAGEDEAIARLADDAAVIADVFRDDHLVFVPFMAVIERALLVAALVIAGAVDRFGAAAAGLGFLFVRARRVTVALVIRQGHVDVFLRDRIVLGEFLDRLERGAAVFLPFGGVGILEAER